MRRNPVGGATGVQYTRRSADVAASPGFAFDVSRRFDCDDSGNFIQSTSLTVGLMVIYQSTILIAS